MELLTEAPGLFLGLIGWAASAKLIFDMTTKALWWRGLLIVFIWFLWIVPAFDVIVYQGLMSEQMAVTYGTTLTGVLVGIVLLSVLSNTNRKNN